MNHTNTMKGNQENVKKKNMSIKLVGGSAGGGGLAGIILLGGALALVTTFAFKRNRLSKSEKNKQEDKLNESKVKDDHALLVGEGLSFLVPDYLSPQLNNHSPSNGTVDTQDEVSRQILLDKNGENNVRNDEEMEISEKARDNTFCDEFSIIKGEFPVPVADNSLPLKLEVDRKNGYLEEVDVVKVDKETMTTECIQVGDACNDQQLPLRIDGNNQEQVEAAHADDQLGLIEKAHTKGGECDGNGKTIIQILVEGVHSNQPGSDNESHKLEDECDGDEIILDKREILIQAAVVDQTRLDEKPHMREEESDDDAGIVTEKGEELIGEVVADNGIILSAELEATTMNGDQDLLCSDGTQLIGNDTETFNSKKLELLLPLIDSSSSTIPGDNDHFQDHLVVENTKILKGDEANEPAIQEDHIKVEEREQTELVEANGDNKEYYKIYREDTNDKFEEADEISVKNDQQMQIWEECQNIHIDENQERYNSGKPLPEINSFQGNGFEVQEFPLPSLGSPYLYKPEKLHKYESAETTLHVEVINPAEKDGLAEEVFAYQIVLEDKPSVQLAGNDEMQSYDDGGDSTAAKGEETLKMSLVSIAQPTNLSEEEDNNDDSKEDEEDVETIQRENFKEGKNLQLPQKDEDLNDNIDREECVNYCDDGVLKDDNDEEEDINNDTEEEYNVEEVEESSETTGDTSLDSNAEAVWPDESVLEFSQKVKDMQANNQNYKEIKEEDSYVKFNSHKLEDDDGNSLMMAHSKKLSADTTTLKQPTNIFNLKFWFLSLLVPFLLLLWLSSSQLSYLASFHYRFE